MREPNRGILLGGIILALGLAPALGQVETPTSTPTPTPTPTPTSLSTPTPSQKNTYAAIAFYKPTRTWAYSTEKATKEEAIADALRKCGHNDARTNWCKNAWMALAISNQSVGGWGSGWGETPADARKKSTDECLARNPDAHIVLCISADGRIDTVTKSH